MDGGMAASLWAAPLPRGGRPRGSQDATWASTGVRRGLWNVAIQVYLTAAVMNLKRLAMPFLVVLAGFP